MKKNEQQGISFNKLILEKTNFEIDPSYTAGDAALSVKLGFSFDKVFSEDKRNLKFVLNTDAELVGVDPSPMKIFVSMAGYFSINKTGDPATLEEFSEIQAPALLFPFTREVIGSLTMRTDFPPLLIPPTNFLALIGSSGDKKGKRLELK